VQHDLVLLLGEGRAVHRVAGVGVRDRLALDPDLLALDRDGRLDVLGDDELLQARATGLGRRLADPQLLLGAGHRLVGRRARGVVADGAALGLVVLLVLEVAELDRVVLVEALLLLGRQLAVGLHVGRVLDERLLVGHAHAVAGAGRLADRHEAEVRAEEAGLDGQPLGLAGPAVESQACPASPATTRPHRSSRVPMPDAR